MLEFSLDIRQGFHVSKFQVIINGKIRQNVSDLDFTGKTNDPKWLINHLSLCDGRLLNEKTAKQVESILLKQVSLCQKYFNVTFQEMNRNVQ